MARTWVRRLTGGRWGVAFAAGAAMLAAVVHVPASLAFPYRMAVGNTTVLSDVPIDPHAMGRVLHRADTLLTASPLWRADPVRQVVLTDGGWRWRVLSLGTSTSVAFRRPFSNALIFNASDVAGDRVWNGAAIGGRRHLSGTIAHEWTHAMTARHIGEVAMARLPAWKREGYADVIAGETSIGGDADEARIRAADPDARVLTYYEGRRRVAAMLARDPSVDALFAP